MLLLGTEKLPIVPITVFDIKGVPGSRRERIKGAVVAGGRHARGPHQAWITANPFHGGFHALITGPAGFREECDLAMDEDPSVIAERCQRPQRSRTLAALLRRAGSHPVVFSCLDAMRAVF